MTTADASRAGRRPPRRRRSIPTCAGSTGGPRPICIRPGVPGWAPSAASTRTSGVGGSSGPGLAGAGRRRRRPPRAGRIGPASGPTSSGKADREGPRGCAARRPHRRRPAPARADSDVVVGVGDVDDVGDHDRDVVGRTALEGEVDERVTAPVGSALGQDAARSRRRATTPDRPSRAQHVAVAVARLAHRQVGLRPGSCRRWRASAAIGGGGCVASSSVMRPASTRVCT